VLMHLIIILQYSKVHTNFFGDTTLVIKSCVGGVFTNVVWLLVFRFNLQIPITNFILF
jgi:hypothetical protein